MELGIGGLARATEIGAGASAVVYKALQVDLDREVAVKVLNTADEAFVRRFHREAKTLGKLSLNPGIVTVHGTGVTESGQLYLILELCESSVLDHLRSKGRFDPESACDVGAQIADAVSDAHTNGVIHRDIKPANLLRSQNGRYLITDFGISTVRGSTLGHTDSVGFTAGYVAPEILKGEEAGTPSDVYSLGATLFHMLAGQPPFLDPEGGTNLLALAQRIINEPIGDLRPQGVPDDICRIVEGAMAKHPIDRPSAAQLRDQLQAFNGRPGASRPIPPVMPGHPDVTIADGLPPAAAPARPEAAAPIMPAADFGPGAASQSPGFRPAGSSPADQTVAMSDMGAPAAAMAPQPAGQAQLQDNQGYADRQVLSGDRTGAAVPPGRANYPLPPHSNDGPLPWKVVLLGALASAVILLGALALVITRSGDGGDDGATDAVLDAPSSNDDASEGSGDDDDGSGGADSLPDGSEPTTAETPDVVGETEDRARTRLTDDGFDVRIEKQISEDDQPGSVIAQFPRAGTDYELGLIVTIVVAAAPEAVLVNVPTVVGLTEAEAIGAIEALGLTVSEPTPEFSELAVGQVIGSDPAEGSSVDSTSSVSLLISKGVEPPDCASLIGLTEEAATAVIEAAALTASSTRAENENDPEGRVTGCTAAETTINLVVSDGPEICGVVTGLGVVEGTAALESKGYTVTATGVLRPDLTVGEIFECAKQQTAASISFAAGLPTVCPPAAFGVTQAEARMALELVGITKVNVERIASDAVAAGRVIDCQLSGETASLSISSGPDVQTGNLAVTVDSLVVESECAGDGLRPELYGSLSLTYDGVTEEIWADRPRGEARTPNRAGQLNLNSTDRWSDVPVGGDLVITWDFKDADKEGRAGDEDGEDDNVSAATRNLASDGATRAWRPTGDGNDNCDIVVNLAIKWTGVGN